MKNQPIKRSDELKTLSREHHLGLLFCWKINQGLKLQVETLRLKKYLNYFWDAHLKDHFLNEEVLLFNRIDVAVCRHAKTDHLAITMQIEKINNTNAEASVFKILVDMLANHIRFEERIVFPILETQLAGSTLQGVALFLEREHKDSFKDEFSDEFWVKNEGIGNNVKPKT